MSVQCEVLSVPVEAMPSALAPTSAQEGASFSKWSVVAAATTLAVTTACRPGEKMTPDAEWHKPPTHEIEQPIGTLRSPWGDLPIRQFRVDVPVKSLGGPTEFEPSEQQIFNDGITENAVKSVVVDPKPYGAKVTYKYERGVGREQKSSSATTIYQAGRKSH